MSQPVTEQEVLNQLSTDEYITHKYNMPGIYSIWIDDQLVYIGCARNMLVRISQHCTEIYNNSSQHRYEIINEALQSGHKVRFDKLQECVDDIPALRTLEGRLIRENLPWLNVQIPNEDNYMKYTYNGEAKVVTLNRILAGKIKICNWEV